MPGQVDVTALGLRHVGEVQFADGASRRSNELEPDGIWRALWLLFDLTLDDGGVADLANPDAFGPIGLASEIELRLGGTDTFLSLPGRHLAFWSMIRTRHQDQFIQNAAADGARWQAALRYPFTMTELDLAGALPAFATREGIYATIDWGTAGDVVGGTSPAFTGTCRLYAEILDEGAGAEFDPTRIRELTRIETDIASTGVSRIQLESGGPGSPQYHRLLNLVENNGALAYGVVDEFRLHIGSNRKPFVLTEQMARSQLQHFYDVGDLLPAGLYQFDFRRDGSELGVVRGSATPTVELEVDVRSGAALNTCKVHTIIDRVTSWAPA